MSKRVRKITTSFGQDEESGGFFAWAWGKFEEKFIENIPNDSIKDLPKNYMWAIGTIAYILSLLTFFYFIATGYRIQRTQEFVSLSEDDGECSEVALTVEGSYYATASGIWEGAESFQYNNAPYFIHLSQYKETEETYAQHMNEIVLPQLKAMAENSTSRNTVDNLMLWMTWTASLRPYIEGDLNYFSMTGDIATVLNRQYFFGITSGVNNTCAADLQSTFDVSSGLANLQYSAEKFQGDDSCKYDLIPEYVGYNSQYDFDVFELQYDMVSAIVCLAVNAGVMKFSVLTRVEERAALVYFDDHLYRFTERVNFHYTGMTPLKCFESMDPISMDFTGYNFCLLELGDTAMLPYLTHWERCDNCDDLDSYCQLFDFLIGGIFFPLEPFNKYTGAGDDDYFYGDDDDFFNGGDDDDYVAPTDDDVAPSDDYTDDTITPTDDTVTPTDDYVTPTDDYVAPTDDYIDDTVTPTDDTPTGDDYIGFSSFEVDYELAPEKKSARSAKKRKLETESARLARRAQFIASNSKKRKKSHTSNNNQFSVFTTTSASGDDDLQNFYVNVTRNNMAGILELLSKYTPRELNRLVYDAAFDASYPSANPNERQRMFEFCQSERYGHCSMLTFNAYDEENQVSKYYHNVMEPSCRDSFTPTDEAWAALSNIPPTEFTQDYYACKASPADAFFNSMGIAAGNTSTLLPIAFLFIMPLVYMYLTSSGNMPPPKEFADDDVDEALKALGLMLLRINAGKTSAVKANSMLMKLTTELVAASKVVHDHPDSDDDDDSDDEEVEEVDGDSRLSVSARGVNNPIRSSSDGIELKKISNNGDTQI